MSSAAMGRRSVVSAGAGATGPLLRDGGLDMSRTPGRHRRGGDRPAGPIIRGRDRGRQTAAPARRAVDLSRARVLASRSLMTPRKITFIGVPLDLGAGRRGVDMGPSAFRLADIHQKVRELGYEVSDAGDMEVSIQETREPGDPRLRFLKEIRSTCEALRDEVVEVLSRHAMPIVLGGDHSIAMGTIAGVSRFHYERKEKIGLVWFDAHGDMNTPQTSPSGNIHGMPLAVALGLGEESLVRLGGRAPMGDGARAAVGGLRDGDPDERAYVEAAGCGAFTVEDT